MRIVFVVGVKMESFFVYFVEDPAASGTVSEKDEVDSRSIYVGNVRLFISILLYLGLFTFHASQYI